MNTIKNFIHRHSFAMIGLGAILIILIAGTVVDWRSLLSPTRTEISNDTKLTLRLAQKNKTGPILANSLQTNPVEDPCYDTSGCNAEALAPLDLSKLPNGSIDPTSFARVDASIDFKSIGTNWICGLDIYYLVDSSSSMAEDLESGMSKIVAVKQAITDTNNWLIAQNPLSRVGVLSFYGSGTFSGNQQQPYPGQTTELSPLTSNINQVNNRLNNLLPVDGTPLPLGIITAKTNFDNLSTGWNRVNVPMIILLSDGVPTIDEEDYAYNAPLVSAVDIKDSSGRFLPPTQVALLGAPDPDFPYGHGRLAGVPLYHSMRSSNLIKQIKNAAGQSNQVNTAGFFLKGVSGGQQTDNPDVIEYFAQVKDPNLIPLPFYTVNNLAEFQSQLRQKLESFCLGNQISEPKVTINLPPRLLYQPDQLSFDDVTYQFTLGNTPSVSPSNGPVSITLEDTDPSNPDPRGRYYQISISNFDKRDERYPLRLTFKTGVSSNNLATLAGYLGEVGNKENLFGGDAACNYGVSQDFVCSKIAVSAESTGISPFELPLFQRIAIPGINVEGNVAAPGQVSGFTLDSRAVAVGGSVSVEGSTSQLDNYIDGQSEVFDWNRISLKMGELYTRGMGLGTGVSSGSYSEANWFLNSNTNNPTNSNSSTFSSPPEGKIWKVNGNLTLGQNNPIAFHGAGTIVINGDLTINDRLICESNTRLGFIVHGRININTDSIGCGAYTALGGNITFKNVSSGQVKGIFIAKGSIKLPSKISLTGPFTVKYDAFFASNPTALYQELLNIVFTTSS